jgi:hypothetical protein
VLGCHGNVGRYGRYSSHNDQHFPDVAGRIMARGAVGGKELSTGVWVVYNLSTGCVFTADRHAEIGHSHSVTDYPPGLANLLDEHDQVLEVAEAMRHMSRSALRWHVYSGRWQQACRSVVVAHSGPITEQQRLWIALLWAGHGAALAGLTAASLDGFKGFADRYDNVERAIHVLIPAGRSLKKERPPLPIAVPRTGARRPFSRQAYSSAWSVSKT